MAILVKCNATDVLPESEIFSGELLVEKQAQLVEGDEVFIWTSERPRQRPNGKGLESRGRLVSSDQSGSNAKVKIQVRISDRSPKERLSMNRLAEMGQKSTAARDLHERIHKFRPRRIWALSEGERKLLEGLFEPASIAEENVRAIVPEEHLLDVLRMLARSIQMADQFAPEKWGVRVNRKSIMLKVGFVEVLQFHNDLFHHLVRGDLVPKRTRSVWHDNFYAAPYKNAPTCDAFDSDLSISKKAYELLLPAHEAAIEIAARSPIHTTTKNDHSPGLVNFISRMVKIALPQPAYVGAFEQIVLYPDEIADQKTFIEGTAISVLLNRYERDQAARNKCIEHHGADCAACGMSFGDYYGSDMSGFIHVHHLVPLSSIREQRTVDPIHDLRPVCPNCHAVIHSSNPPLTVDQVRSLIEKHGKI